MKNSYVNVTAIFGRILNKVNRIFASLLLSKEYSDELIEAKNHRYFTNKTSAYKPYMGWGIPHLLDDSQACMEIILIITPLVIITYTN